MTAAVHRRFGGPEVVSLEEVPRPRIRPDQVLVRVHASTVSIADHRVRSLDLPRGLWLFGPISLGIRRPRHPVLGMDLAGVIVEVGADVTNFRVGDEVIAMKGSAFGGHAQYAPVRADRAIALKPASLDFEESVALVFGGVTALSFLDAAGVAPGDAVLVNGASGAVGSAAVQIAKHLGARVTAVTSETNRELVRSLGADEVIDYATQDFAANGRTWRVIVECVGNAPFSRVGGNLEAGGVLLLVIADLRSMLTAKLDAWRSGKRILQSGTGTGAELLARLARLADDGVIVPVIDRTYALTEIVEAHRYVDTGRKKGNVVIRVA